MVNAERKKNPAALDNMNPPKKIGDSPTGCRISRALLVGRVDS